MPDSRAALIDDLAHVLTHLPDVTLHNNAKVIAADLLGRSERVDAALAGAPPSGAELWQEIQAERRRQDAKWGGPNHDDSHRAEEWASFIVEHAHKAVRGVQFSDFATFRRRMIEVAALAVAAIESEDRVGVPPASPTPEPEEKT